VSVVVVVVVDSVLLAACEVPDAVLLPLSLDAVAAGVACSVDPPLAALSLPGNPPANALPPAVAIAPTIK